MIYANDRITITKPFIEREYMPVCRKIMTHQSIRNAARYQVT